MDAEAPGDILLVEGAPGSPYTRKMLAVLRYRRIPFGSISVLQAAQAGLPRPKVALLPTFHFPMQGGGREAATDSTPLIRRLEREVAGRNVLPRDPVLAFLDAIIEDYADEWLTKAMFHYRWHHAADRAKAGTILMLHHHPGGAWDQIEVMARAFTERQVGRLRYVGSNEITAPVIEASYARLLRIFESVLQARPFLFGARPAAADFAIFGQLTQLTHFDPTPSALALQAAPRVYAWVEVVEDLSGVADDAAWAPAGDAAAGLHDLLCEIGRVYVPLLLANARAIAAGAALVETKIDGLAWRQNPFAYHVKCLAELRRLHAALAPEARARADACLAGTGVELLFPCRDITG
jgi:glutathione S-transferase